MAMRSKNIFMKLVFIFITVPFVELFILLQLAEKIGALYTFLIIIITGITGAYLAKSEGKAVITRIKNDLRDGQMPKEELLNGLCILVGGALLLTPGILTDMTGFSLIIPFTRDLYTSFIKKKFMGYIKRGQTDIF